MKISKRLIAYMMSCAMALSILPISMVRAEDAGGDAGTAEGVEEGSAETDHYDADGFCRWWKADDGCYDPYNPYNPDDENCNGYEPAEKDESDVYQIDKKGKLLWLLESNLTNYTASVTKGITLSEDYTVPIGSTLIISENGSLSGASVTINGTVINYSKTEITKTDGSNGTLHQGNEQNGYCVCGGNDCGYFKTFSITGQPTGGKADRIGAVDSEEGRVNQLSVTVEPIKSGANIEYQWYEVGQEESVEIENATGNIYELPTENYTIGETHRYRCKVTCDGKEEDTSIAIIEVVGAKRSISNIENLSKIYDGKSVENRKRLISGWI